MNHPPMKKAIWYRDCWLAPGSLGHQLHTDGRMKELVEHMADVDRRDKALRGEK